MSCYIYLNTYTNGYLYVGSHVWDGTGIDPNYFGSSLAARKFKWKPSKIEILEEAPTSVDLLRREHDYIEEYAAKYGIAPCIRSNPWTIQFKQGVLLNGHSNDAVSLRGTASSPEIRQKAEKTKKERGNSGAGIKARLRDPTAFAEASRKSIRTRLERDPHALDALHLGGQKYVREHPDYKFGERTVPVHPKGVETRKQKGSYKTDTLTRVLHATGAGGNLSIRAVVVKGPFGELTFPSLIQCETGLESYGFHVTRATIAQGLKRCNGVYKYKDILIFYDRGLHEYFKSTSCYEKAYQTKLLNRTGDYMKHTILEVWKDSELLFSGKASSCSEYFSSLSEHIAACTIKRHAFSGVPLLGYTIKIKEK